MNRLYIDCGLVGLTTLSLLLSRREHALGKTLDPANEAAWQRFRTACEGLPPDARPMFQMSRFTKPAAQLNLAWIYLARPFTTINLTALFTLVLNLQPLATGLLVVTACYAVAAWILAFGNNRIELRETDALGAAMPGRHARN